MDDTSGVPTKDLIEVFLASRVLGTTRLHLLPIPADFCSIADKRKVSISEGIVEVQLCFSSLSPGAHRTGEYFPVMKPLLWEEHASETTGR